MLVLELTKIDGITFTSVDGQRVGRLVRLQSKSSRPNACRIGLDFPGVRICRDKVAAKMKREAREQAREVPA